MTGSTLKDGSIRSYSLTLTTIERDAQTIFRLRMHWMKHNSYWRHYRKTWKYKLIQNAMNKVVALTVQFGQPAEVKIFGYDANLSELGLRVASGPAEPR